MAQEVLHDDDIELLWASDQETETMDDRITTRGLSMDNQKMGVRRMSYIQDYETREDRFSTRGLSMDNQKMAGRKVNPKLTARDLSIVWGSDFRYWKWTQIKENSGKLVDVAELLNVCWLQVDGKYEAQKLSLGRKYEVFFVVMLKDNLWTNGPVNLRLSIPDGTKQERQEDLKVRPRNKWIGLKLGVVDLRMQMYGDIKFSLNGNDGRIWKRGLVIIGALFVPTQ